jgi:hypothetical protein
MDTNDEEEPVLLFKVFAVDRETFTKAVVGFSFISLTLLAEISEIETDERSLSLNFGAFQLPIYEGNIDVNPEMDWKIVSSIHAR